MDISEWKAVHKITGDEIEISLFATKSGGDYKKVFPKEFSKLISCTGTGAESVLAWIVDNLDSKNQLHGTQRGIAKEIGVSYGTLYKVFKALMDNDFLKMQRSGLYVLNSKAMHYGNEINRMAILKVWTDLDQ